MKSIILSAVDSKLVYRYLKFFLKAADTTTGIWLSLYDIAAADRDHYVDWFHRFHIPEKRVRRGYRWSAHFEAAPTSGNSDLYQYIGLFGEDSNRVFLDQSPAQLKLT